MPTRVVFASFCLLMTSQRGVTIRQWEWPEKDCRLQPAASHQLNDFLSWHCTARCSATLHFYCENEIAKFPVGAAGAEDRQILAKVQEL